MLLSSGEATPLTQKVIFSSNGQLRGGEQGTRCLIFVLRGNIFMAYGTLHQGGEGSAPERRFCPTPAPCCIARGSAALVTAVGNFRASSISVPAAVYPLGWSGRSDRGYRSGHLETSATHDRAVEEACKKQRADDGSNRDKRFKRVSRCSEEAWLSRVPRADPSKFTFPIRLIGCSSQNSCRPMTSWCPVLSARSVGA